MFVGGCWWFWIVVGGFWMLVNGCEFLWMVVGSCGQLQVVAGGCGWLWLVVGGSILQYNPKNTLLLHAVTEYILSTELKDSERLLFKFSLQSLNPSRKFPKCFIIFTSYFIVLDFCKLPSNIIFLCFLYNLFPNNLEFPCLMNVTFQFTIFYRSIYKKKEVKRK